MPDRVKIDLKEIDKRLQDIFPMPQIMAKILKVINDPQASAANIEQVFKFEPSFTLKILTLANSSYYGSPGNITNIRAAITLLGFNLIKNIAVHASVNELFKFGNSSAVFSGYELWKHSVGVGVCAKMLARRLRLGNAEDFFTLGILHDVGLIIEFQFYREHFLNVLSRLKESTSSIVEIEQEVMGIDHAQLMETICIKWNMQMLFSEMLKYHHAPLEAPAESRRSVCALYVANEIVKNKKYGFYYGKQTEIVPEILKVLGITKVDLEVMGEDFDDEILDITLMFDSSR